jgi:Tfp pilus assembly protein PilN
MEYLRIKKITDDLNELATELDGWNESRTSWYSLLSKLQATLPENIQLTTMDINDKIIARKGTESGENTTELYRKFKIEINGYAHDPSSESTVVNFIDNVREANKTNKAFEKITLSSMGKNPNEEHVSFFVISIEGKERDLK